MRELNLQDPEPGLRMRVEIPEVAGLENGVRKIAHAMPFDVEVQLPPKRDARSAAKSYKALPPAPVVRQ